MSDAQSTNDNNNYRYNVNHLDILRVTNELTSYFFCFSKLVKHYTSMISDYPDNYLGPRVVVKP